MKNEKLRLIFVDREVYREVYREVRSPYLPMLNPHGYWSEWQIGRLTREKTLEKAFFEKLKGKT